MDTPHPPDSWGQQLLQQGILAAAGGCGEAVWGAGGLQEGVRYECIPLLCMGLGTFGLGIDCAFRKAEQPVDGDKAGCRIQGR